jgi:hypothetical protein
MSPSPIRRKDYDTNQTQVFVTKAVEMDYWRIDVIEEIKGFN